MKLLKNAVYIEDLNILAVADLHVGYEASLIGAGFLISRAEKLEIIKNFKEIFDFLIKRKKKIKEIVICGDLKHKFGGFSLEEWKEVKEILKFLSEHGKIILLRGNHDEYLEALEDRYEVRDYYKKNKVCFVHGDKLYKECLDAEIIIVGHFHPVIKLREGAKTESFKCFLIGKWKGKEIIILPAFITSSEGGMIPEQIQEAIETEKGVRGVNINKFGVFVPGKKVEEVYKFGKVGKLIKL